MPSPDIQTFLSWFQSHDGWIDTESMDIVQFPASEGGRGAVALKDIPEGHAIFSIPRSLVLSTRTSALPSKIGKETWRRFGLHDGWSGLILCMMWESALGSSSKWSTYFDILPSTFDTPMFWNDDDLAELQGTCVVEKLGRDQAETDYNEKVVPAVASRPDLFAMEDISTRYSLEMYHIMGSRVLSRSFTIQMEDIDSDDQDENDSAAASSGDTSSTSIGSAMSVDTIPAVQSFEVHAEHDHDHDHAAEREHEEAETEADAGSDGEDEDEDVAIEVMMLPLADLLNARYQSENVMVFYEPGCLKMVATKPIKAGEQIWNTYGNQPNAELLRAYGYIDYLPLPGGNGAFGSPGDVAELRADLLVQALGTVFPRVNLEMMEERIDWWLDEGGDDAFLLDLETTQEPGGEPTVHAALPEVLLSFARLLVSDSEWKRAKAKGRPPRPTLDTEPLRVVLEALTRRLAMYPTGLEEDLAIVQAGLDTLSLNRRHALIVRMGEKRILETAMAQVAVMVRTLEGAQRVVAAAEHATAKREGKRKAQPEAESRKRRR